MFRKLIIMIAFVAGVISASAALPLDKYSINRKDLPEPAREMLDEHFPKAKVSMVKVDRHLLKKTDYDVRLTNGAKIEFSNKGKWTNVDCKKKSVPESLVPKAIRNSVAKKYQIVTTLEETFPASRLTNPQTFTSLLFYYGMLTIKGTFGDMMILGIPNNNVRKQYYGYLLEQYQEEKFVDLNQIKILFTYMALEGKWREGLQFMADAYSKVSSVRDGIESERNLQGFFMAYLNLNNYYYTAPELELNHGYCDFFLLPNLTHYATKHSYILELKVLSKKDYESKPEDGKLSKAETQWQEAEEQINRYAAAPRVEALRQGTTLHKIIMQFVAGKLVRMEEVVC